MEIKSVKIQCNGYLLNNEMFVPKANGNREYELVKEWIAEGNEPEEEFTEKELNQQRITSIKSKANDVITLKYPIFKQLNITNLLDGYTQKDKDVMIEFISGIRKVANEAEITGLEYNQIEWGI